MCKFVWDTSVVTMLRLNRYNILLYLPHILRNKMLMIWSPSLPLLEITTELKLVCNIPRLHAYF